MTCTFTLQEAERDVEMVFKVKEHLRALLLQGLSEAREMTLQMEPAVRDSLMDDLSYYFHPEGGIMSDAFNDCFLDAEFQAKDRLEEVQNEMASDRRRAGYMTAAE